MSLAPVPRSRSRILVDKIKKAHAWAVLQDGSTPSSWFYDTQFRHTVTESIQDCEVPDFHRRRNAGEIFQNPYTKVKTIVDCEPMSRNFGYTDKDVARRPPTCLGTYFSLPPQFLALSPDPGSSQDVAVTEAYANVTSSTASLLVTLGEIKETKEMVLSNLTRLYKVKQALGKLLLAYQTIKRNSKSGISFEELSSIHKLSDLWLEVRYGFVPLIYDVKAIQETYCNLSQKRPERQTFRGHQAYDQHVRQEVYATGDPFTAKNKWLMDTIIEGKSNAGVLASHRLGAVADPWGLTKIPSAIVDLTTLSFVLNWVFDVSETVAAWTPDPFWEPLSSWVTNRWVRLSTATHLESVMATGKVGKVWGQISWKREEFTQRIPSPPRSLLPSFRFQMDWKRYIDAVALAKKPLFSILGSLRDAMRK